ncbi:MAG: hypothetical protein R6X02_35890 [Enhygromyxa sp.]
MDPVVIEVCRLIRIDHYQAADMLWEREHAGRRHEGRGTASGGRASAIGDDTLTIARTFLERAEELERTNAVQAREAAQRANQWARQAATDLEDPDAPAVQDVAKRVKRLARALNR